MKNLFLVAALQLAVLPVLPATVFPAFERLPAGARAQAMCDAGNASYSDPFSFLTNPSVLSRIGPTQVGMTYSPGLFNLKELRRYEGAAGVHLNELGVGTDVRIFGESLYRELTVTAAMGEAVAERLDVGFGVSWYHLAIAGYGSASAFGFHAGLTYHLLDQLRYGAAVLNVNRPTIGQCREQLVAEALSSLEFSPVQTVTIALGLQKDERSSLGVASGVAVLVADVVSLRAGACEALRQCAAGAAFMLGGARFEYTCTFHPDLGVTHHLSVVLELE